MRSAIIKDGAVINVIVGAAKGAIPCNESVSIGWTYDGKFHAPAPEPEPDAGALDQDALNRALTAEGSVVRALAILTFEEINRLRARAGLPAYTIDQFKSALKARMRG